MIPPYTYAAARLAEERRKDTMREGEQARLMRMARPVRPGPVDRALGKIGDLLVAGGRGFRSAVNRPRLAWRTRWYASASDGSHGAHPGSGTPSAQRTETGEGSTEA